MRRVLVYGVSGAGKSTLAQRIAVRAGLPYHSVDDLAWEPGWVEVPPEVLRERIAAICATEAWVLDSAYAVWMDLPLGRADLIVGLDLARWRSWGRLVRRTAVGLVRRTEICNGNRERLRDLFARDSILVLHFRSFERKRRRMRAWHADPAMPTVVLLRTPAEVERWLAGLSGAGEA